VETGIGGNGKGTYTFGGNGHRPNVFSIGTAAVNGSITND